MKPSKDYLKKLLDDTLEIAKNFDFSDVDVTDAKISYLATKKYNWLGLHEGIASLAEIKAKRTKYSDKIRSSCGYYNKFYYVSDKLIKVESYVDGHDRLSNWQKTYYTNNKRYLYPGGTAGQNGFDHIFVTEYKEGKVYEEYMVGKRQIVFWRYDYTTEGKIATYNINYVPTGNHPILSESMGFYDESTLEYEETSNYKWYQEL